MAPAVAVAYAGRTSIPAPAGASLSVGRAPPTPAAHSLVVQVIRRKSFLGRAHLVERSVSQLGRMITAAGVD